MNLRNSRIIALVIVLVIISSAFIVQFKVTDKFDDARQNNYNSYYMKLESIGIFEEGAIQSENLQFLKLKNNFSFNLFKIYILTSLLYFANIFKLNYTSFISEMFKLNNYSVFVALFINKEDGKKRYYVYK